VKKNNKGDEGLWVRKVEDAAEILGNESRPYSETSVYVRYAAIVKKITAVTEGK
jgi:hypothetical protein